MHFARTVGERVRLFEDRGGILGHEWSPKASKLLGIEKHKDTILRSKGYVKNHPFHKFEYPDLKGTEPRNFVECSCTVPCEYEQLEPTYHA